MNELKFPFMLIQTDLVNKFGESWAVDPTCLGCPDCIEKDECREKDLIEEAQQACHVLINVHGK